MKKISEEKFGFIKRKKEKEMEFEVFYFQDSSLACE